MYKQLLLASTLSLGLMAAPSAMAGKDGHWRGYDGGHGRGNVVKHRDNRRDVHRIVVKHDDHGRNLHRQYQRHDHRADYRSWQHEREHRWKGPRFRAATYHRPHGFYRHGWRAGERLPYGYRATRYVVNDFHHYHLYAPPRGHQWVRVDHDAVLTAIATGVVAAVVYDLFA